MDYDVNAAYSSAYLVLVLHDGWDFFHNLKKQLTSFWLTSSGITQRLRQCHSWLIINCGWHLLRRLRFDNGIKERLSVFAFQRI